MTGSKYAAVDRVQLLDELVCTLVQAAPGCSELEQQAVQNKLFGYVVRVADSGIASNAAEDSDTVFHAIRQRLVQQQRQDDAARCEINSTEFMTPRWMEHALSEPQCMRISRLK